MDDYDYDDRPCPSCGHEPTHRREYGSIGCEDGWIDMYEFDDPLWYSPGEYEQCRECMGRGFHWWCPECGTDCAAIGALAEARPERSEQ